MCWGVCAFPWLAACISLLAEPDVPLREQAAADGRIELHWRVPEGCGTELEVRDAIARFVSEPIDPHRARDVRVETSVTGTETSLGRLEVRVVAPFGRVDRAVDVSSCEAIVDVAGVIIAVALDRLAEEAARQSNAPESPPPVAELASPMPHPTPEPVVTRRAAPRPRRRPVPALRADAIVETGALPGVGAGVALATGLQIRRARVELFGVYLPPREASPFADEPDAGARIQLGAAGIRACFVPAVGKLEVPACVAGEGGAARAHGRGLTTERTAHDGWAAAAVSAALSWVPVPRFALTLRAEGLAVLYRAKFIVGDLGEVHHVARASARIYLGPEARF